MRLFCSPNTPGFLLGCITFLGAANLKPANSAEIVSYYFESTTQGVIGFASYERPPIGSQTIRSTVNLVQVGYLMKTFSFVWNGQQYLATDFGTSIPPHVIVQDAFIPAPPEPSWNRAWDEVWFGSYVESASGSRLSVELAFEGGDIGDDTVFNSPALPADLTTWPYKGGPWFTGYADTTRVINEYDSQFGFLRSKVTAPGGRALDSLDSVWLGASGSFSSPAAWSDGEVPTNRRALFSLAPAGPAPEVVTFDSDTSLRAIEFINNRNLDFQLDTHALSVNDSLIVGHDIGKTVTLTLTNGALFAPEVTVGRFGNGTLNVNNTEVYDAPLIMGAMAGSSGTVVLTGANARWDNNLSATETPVIVGKSGTGTLTVTAGAQMSVAGSSLWNTMIIGKEAGSNGTVTVQGTGSQLLVQSEIVVGASGTGSLIISQGGHVGGTGFAPSHVNVKIGARDTGYPFATANGTGTLVIDGSGSKLLAADLTIGAEGHGSVTVKNGGVLEIDNFSHVVIGNYNRGGGELVIQDAGSQLTQGDFNFGFDIGNWARADFKVLNGATAWTQGDATIARIPTAAGSTVLVDGAGSHWRSTFVTAQGDFGSIRVVEDATITVSNGGTITTALLQQFHGGTNFDIVLNDGHLVVDKLELKRGGLLSGKGTINGNVVMGGVVSPGQSPGKLSITGTYLQTTDGVLKIELAGNTPGTQYDVVEVSGAVTLSGKLILSLVSGFTPAPSDTFDFLSAASISGTFSQVIFEGGTANVTYTATGVRLSNIQRTTISLANQWGLAGSGNWGDSGNWTDGVIPQGNTATARLGGKLTGAATVDLQNVDRTVKVLSFDHLTASYTVGSSGGGRLILEADAGQATIEYNSTTNTRNHAITAGIRFNSATDVAVAGNTLSLLGQIDWNGQTVTVQSGTLRLGTTLATNVLAGSTLNIQTGATTELSGTVSNTSNGVNRVSVMNHGTLLVTGIDQSAGDISGTGSTVLGTNAVFTANRVVQAALTLNGEATAGNNAGRLVLRDSAGGAAGSPLPASRIGTLSIDYDNVQGFLSTLDLRNNDLIIDNANLAGVYDILRSGMRDNSDPTWDGTGLTSSYAADTANALFGRVGLGAIRNSADPTTTAINPAYTEFSGHTLTGNETLVKFTWYGDFNLDGRVTSLDFALLDAGQAGTVQADGTAGWFFGDVNLDGQVDSFDLAFVNAGYLAFQSNGSFPLPEPSTLLLTGCGILGLWVANCRRGRTSPSRTIAATSDR